MLSEEDRNNYLRLLIGIAIGMMLGFVFGMVVGGSLPTDPPVGLFRIDVFSTTFYGCLIALGFALVYLYLTEWSKKNSVVTARTTEAGAE
jgi:predicted lysophospholipase L1 biosynthesis ABC-type transport system permease subunit